MTQQQLAEQVQSTRQTIVAIKKGKYSPSLEWHFVSLKSYIYRSTMYALTMNKEFVQKTVIQTLKTTRLCNFYLLWSSNYWITPIDR